MDSNGREASENMMQNSEVELEDETENMVFEVGDFVAAVYEGDWLLTQFDIDQGHAGDTHVNLTYMKKVGKTNLSGQSKMIGCLLTLWEDILFKCSAPILVGSSIRASHVGLPGNQAAQADAALDLIVYLQQSLFSSFNQILVLKAKWEHLFCGEGGRSGPTRSFPQAYCHGKEQERPLRPLLPQNTLTSMVPVLYKHCLNKDPKVQLILQVYTYSVKNNQLLPNFDKFLSLGK
jgi:hypothetical protein